MLEFGEVGICFPLGVFEDFNFRKKTMLVSFSIYVLTFEDEIRLAVINIKDTRWRN